MKAKKLFKGLFIFLFLALLVFSVGAKINDDLDLNKDKKYKGFEKADVYAKVKFKTDITTKKQLKELEKVIKITNKKVSIDSKKYPELNIPATLTFYNVCYDNPVAVHNGKIRFDIDINKISHCTIEFDVDSFSSWTIIDNTWNGTFNGTTVHPETGRLVLSPLAWGDFDFESLLNNITIEDQGAQSNDFDLTTSPSLSTNCKFGSECLNFDGVDDYVLLNDNLFNIDSFEEEYYACVWFTRDGTTDSYHAILGGIAGTSNSYPRILVDSAGGAVRSYAYNSTSSLVSAVTSTTLNVGEPNLICMGYNSSSEQLLTYVNGVLGGTQDLDVLNYDNYSTTIGKYNSDAPSYKTNGELECVQSGYNLSEIQDINSSSTCNESLASGNTIPLNEWTKYQYETSRYKDDITGTIIEITDDTELPKITDEGCMLNAENCLDFINDGVDYDALPTDYNSPIDTTTMQDWSISYLMNLNSFGTGGRTHIMDTISGGGTTFAMWASGDYFRWIANGSIGQVEVSPSIPLNEDVWVTVSFDWNGTNYIANAWFNDTQVATDDILIDNVAWVSQSFVKFFNPISGRAFDGTVQCLSVYDTKFAGGIPARISESTECGDYLLNDDPEFDDASEWVSMPSCMEVTGGELVVNCTGSEFGFDQMDNGLEVIEGQVNEICFDITNYTSGTFKTSIGGYGQTSAGASAIGHYCYDLTVVNSLQNGRLYVQASSGFVGTVDNIEVKPSTVVQYPLQDFVNGDMGAFSVEEEGYPSINAGLTDLDMETTGVGEWIADNNALLTKETINPAEGTQLLRIAYDGTSNPNARKNDLTEETTYRIIGKARSDGTNIPKIVINSELWIGTTSTEWQDFDIIFEAKSYVLRLWMTTSSNGYVEFDDIVITEQSTALYCNGINDIIEDDNFPILTKNFTYAMWYKTEDTNGGIYNRDTEFSISLYPQSGSDARFRVYASNSTTANEIFKDTTNTGDNTWHHGVITYDGSLWQMYIDGINTVNSTIITGDIKSTVTDSTLCYYGTQYYEGYLDEFSIYERVLTADEIYDFYSGEDLYFEPEGEYISEIYNASEYDINIYTNKWLSTVFGGENLTANQYSGDINYITEFTEFFTGDTYNTTVYTTLIDANLIPSFSSNQMIIEGYGEESEPENWAGLEMQPDYAITTGNISASVDVDLTINEIENNTVAGSFIELLEDGGSETYGLCGIVGINNSEEGGYNNYLVLWGSTQDDEILITTTTGTLQFNYNYPSGLITCSFDGETATITEPLEEVGEWEINLISFIENFDEINSFYANISTVFDNFEYETLGDVPDTIISGEQVWAKAGNCDTLTSQDWTQATYSNITNAFVFDNEQGECFQYKLYIDGDYTYTPTVENATISSYKFVMPGLEDLSINCTTGACYADSYIYANATVLSTDTETLNINYTWYKNGFEVSTNEFTNLTNDTVVDISYGMNQSKGDILYFTAQPYISTLYGDVQGSFYTSVSIVIENTNVSITSYSPNTAYLNLTQAETEQFEIYYYDLDGDASVTWYLDGDEAGTGDTFEFPTAYTYADDYNLSVNVSDGFSSDSHSWAVTITEVDRDGIYNIAFMLGAGLIMAALMAFAFIIDKEHFLLKLLCIFFVTYIIMIIGKYSNVMLFGTVFYNISITFMKVTLWFFRIFTTYVFVYFIYRSYVFLREAIK